MSRDMKEKTLTKTIGTNAKERANAWGFDRHPYTSEGQAFPDDFFWCGAMCATQAEGAFDEGGKGLSVFDVVPIGEERKAIATGLLDNRDGHIGTYFPSRKAADFYHRYREDVELMAKLGLNSYKVSISWSRIFPTGEEERPSEEGLQFYRNLIKKLKDHDMEPILEITHWDLPLALSVKYGGWKDRKLIDCYMKLVKALCDGFGEEISYWLTIHEPDCMHDYPFVACGLVKEEEEKWPQDKLDASHHMFVASARAAAYIRKRFPKAIVGTMIGLTYKYPYSCDPRDQLLAVRERMLNWLYADVLIRGYYPSYAIKEFERKGLQIPFEEGDEQLLRENTISFMMFSYYNSQVIRHDSYDVISNPYVENDDDPTGLRVVLNLIYDRYQIPIIIGELAYKSIDTLTEGEVHDENRIRFLKTHLRAIKDAIFEDGIDVRGCMFWETVDSISVGKGVMSERYGLIYVDADDEGNGTYDRHVKDSYKYLKQVIADKGKSL